MRCILVADRRVQSKEVFFVVEFQATWQLREYVFCFENDVSEFHSDLDHFNLAHDIPQTC